MSVLLQIWHAVQAVIVSADYYTLGAAVVIIIIAGFLIEGVRSILPATLAALLAFVLVKFALALSVGNQHDVEALARADWRAFVDLKMLVLLAHALIFGVLIGIVSTIRSMIR
jgi:hypothetical protein